MKTVFPLRLSRLARDFVINERVLPESQRLLAQIVFDFAAEELPTDSHNCWIGNMVEEKSVPEACTADVVALHNCCCRLGGFGVG